ncbi:hypothetical protein [Fibrobacter sp.]|uniref:hypothetical protein n=1 Tax=Fibrobacter sp. TaxID=35828 RepID=UPI00386FA00E
MNLKKTIAMTLVSVAFAMAQEQPAAAPANAAETATAQPAAEVQPVEKASAAPAAEAAQPAQEAAKADEAKPAEVAAPAEQPQTAEPVAQAPEATAEAPAAAVAPAAPAEVAVAPAPENAAPAPEGAVRMGPPKTPFTVLHGNAYNRVENEAAADNVNGLLNKSLTKMAFNKFFYVEPSGEMGVVSLGGFFGAMDISGQLGRATLGYATPVFAVAARIGLGQIKTDTKSAEVKETIEGDDWGLTLSATLGGYSVTLAGDWTTFANETSTEPKNGPEIEQRYRDLDASLIVSDGPSAQKHFWSAGVAFNRHEDEMEVGETLIGDSLASSISIVPVFSYGVPVLRASYANVYMGVNSALPITIYDKADMRDTTSGKLKEVSLKTVGLSLTPNILGEVLLTESLMLFGEASYTWEAFRYVDSKTPYDNVEIKKSVSDKVDASMGFRYQYKNWAACEFAFGDSFFTDTKSIFNGEGVFVSFGGFIYF